MSVNDSIIKRPVPESQKGLQATLTKGSLSGHKQKIGLQLKADLENLTNLRPDGDDFRWYIRLRCSNCSEETKEFQYISLAENAPLKGGRGHASLVLKCKLCGRENSIDIMRDSIQPYNDEDNGRFKTVVAFDCRGVEPIDFSARAGFAADGVDSGTPFTDIAFNEGDDDWSEYDTKSNCPVGVFSIEHKFISMKK
ncbi:hypothetical protein FSP39_016974 [Pinctada imbricata]|uniref:CXXC motif containing zinc binding protein n=1 Tax=Pinctada imbricata TaxID=66713 RepID=A0AA88YGL4_PINIB|nr:hypothetical protein FSP39_016974 [Pinctada imbricata]